MTPRSTVDADAPLSAQVVLRGQGRTPTSESVVTSATVDAYRPEPAAAQAVRRTFETLGFQVGPLAGNSFSITGPAALFQRTFGARFRRTPAGGLLAMSQGGAAGQTLPLAHLPDALKHGIAAVTFTPPPDFGPANFGP